MENVLLSINTQITKGEYFAYFLPEIIYIAGIFINLVFYIFRKRRESTNRYSDFFTSIVLSVNTVILFSLGIKNHVSIDDINFSFARKIFYYNNDLMLLKAAISLFGLFYLFTMYRIIRKTRIKTALLNSLLLCILFSTNFLLYSTNFLVTYMLLETIVFLIYKYGSLMRIRKAAVFSVEFLAISLTASILFVALLNT